MAFKRSSVRSRLSPPRKNLAAATAARFFFFCKRSTAVGQLLLLQARAELICPDTDPAAVLNGHIFRLQRTASELVSGTGITSLESLQLYCAAELLQTYKTLSETSEDSQKAFTAWKSNFTSRTAALQEQTVTVGSRSNLLFRFFEKVFLSGQELPKRVEALDDIILDVSPDDYQDKEK